MKFKILIADDEIEFRDILVSIVEMIFIKYFPSMKLEISLASNGQEELSIAQSESQDIIITDINMPVMNGKEAVKKIRLFDKSVPILALTALTNPKDVKEIIQSGVSNYSSKPLDNKLFIAQIKAFVDFYIRGRFNYNKSAVNLISKEIFKRKTIFSIEKLEDLLEFWEYILELNTIEEDNIEEILQYMYNFEEQMVKSCMYNEIILEENTQNYYFTLSDINEDMLIEFLMQYSIKKDMLSNNSHFITFVIRKKSYIEDIKKDTITKESPTKELREIDIRYSIHEKLSAQDLAEELDPSMEDKIENFDEYIEFLREKIYNFEETNNTNERESLMLIVEAFNEFNTIIENIGLFNVINRTFNHLISFLENIENAILFDLQKRILLVTLLRGIVDDLEQWIVSLFLEKNAPDIHYFDASFAENCLEIESIFLENENQDDNDDDSLDFF